MYVRLCLKTTLCVVLMMVWGGCSFYIPEQGNVIIEVRDHEAYYAGFFRACEMLSRQHIEGNYSYVHSSRSVTGLEPTDQCLQMVQRMMDLNAAHDYSRNWPGMMPLSLEYGGWSESEILTGVH